MPKRGAFALGRPPGALALLLNFQTPSLEPVSATAKGGAGGTSTTGTGSTGTGSTGTGSTGSTGSAPTATRPPTATHGPTATDAPSTTGTRTVTGPVVNTRWGAVQVEVTLDGSQLLDVTALQLPGGDRRSSQISSYAEPVLRTQALAAQGASIDGISGATYTSIAYARSLQAALDGA
jgi:uncharacterized protein with FMN-binding domain